MLKLCNLRVLPNYVNTKFIHTSGSNFIDHKWREANRLCRNPNTEGPLTDLPDFTYMDGRPTPFGRAQKFRLINQQRLAEKIYTGTKEIEFAINRHKKLKEDEIKNKQDILDSKFKRKGHHLLQKNE
ncbi:CLUMA_CG012962, isoform A [Clunio marinus]|uniref:Large ribosomal subunit protein mL52 n=1 Tax=Clunio marinus TaxID=568069 RepID=A0A1J1IKY4_9DIPT|nr:CLUMA_CG012962, isoform A [Clunio marinus]